MGNVGFIFAIAAAVTWGLVYTIDQKVLSSVSPLVLLFVYSIFTAIIMLPFIFFDNGSIKTLLGSGKMNLLLIIVSATLMAIANFFIYSAIKHLDASTASMIEIAYPFFVVLFGFIIFRTIPNMYFFIGGLLMFIGSIIILKFAS